MDRPSTPPTWRNKSGSNNSATGIDRLSKERLKEIGTNVLVSWFNRFLTVGAIPKALKRYRMVLIPKSDGATHPKDFRPISVGSIIIRLFSGILNRRIARISTNEAQRGFKSGVEGVAQLN